MVPHPEMLDTHTMTMAWCPKSSYLPLTVFELTNVTLVEAAVWTMAAGLRWTLLRCSDVQLPVSTQWESFTAAR